MKTEKFFDYEETMNKSYLALEKEDMALQDFLDTYSANIEPTPQKALKFANSTHSSDCAYDEKMSYKLLVEYDKMMWLIQVASDYCFNASESLKEALEHDDIKALETAEADNALTCYRNDIDTMLSSIHNSKDMRKIYSFIMGFVD